MPENDMEHRAEFRFTGPGAEHIYTAIAPEMAGETNFRSCARCWVEPPETLVLSVQAQDAGALRAALNMWLRLVNVAREMHELIPSKGGHKQ